MSDTRRRSAKGRPIISVSAAFRTASAGWASLGACRDSDPDLFFPIASSGLALQQIAEAKAVCARCPVRVDCLSYALETGQDAGVWGGASAEERRKIRSAGAAAGMPPPRRERR
jgi:WhiB family transcriptional regulator, redox-sensing transcriptional regulator